MREARRAAMASAVASGFGLVNSVETKLLLLLLPLESFDVVSMVKAKAAPRHRMGCWSNDSAKCDGTVNKTFDLPPSKFSTKKGTIVCPLLLVLLVAEEDMVPLVLWARVAYAGSIILCLDDIRVSRLQLSFALSKLIGPFIHF